MFIIGGFNENMRFCSEECYNNSEIIAVGDNTLFDTDTREFIVAVNYVTIRRNNEWIKIPLRKLIEKEEMESNAREYLPYEEDFSIAFESNAKCNDDCANCTLSECSFPF